MKTDISSEIKQYNDIVEAGIRHGDKSRLMRIKKAIKEKNNGSLKGLNKHLPYLDYLKINQFPGLIIRKFRCLIILIGQIHLCIESVYK